MFSPHKLLLRAISVALVVSPIAIAVGCSEGDAPLDLDFDTDSGTPDSGADDVGSDAGARPDGARPDAAPDTSSCGNGKVDPGEECDDKNRTSGDGCSSTCKHESAGPGDLCSNALEIALEQQDGGTLYKASVPGSTSPLFNQYAATCGGGSGADIVYKVTSPTVGRVVARVVAPFQAVLSARTACEDLKTELACRDNTSSKTGASEVAFPVFANTPVYLFVDGFGGSKGDFVLDVEVQTAFCGNGQAEYPEQCDDGNTIDGDGCSATCGLEDTSTPSACPGMAYRVTDKASFAGDTSALTNGGGSATGCLFTGSGPNAVYAITPAVTGALKLDLLANFPNALLHIRRECEGTTNTSQFDCAAATQALTPISTVVPVFAEQTIFVFVDSNAESNAGLYTLNATLSAAACGDGLVGAGEECDDGNATDGDGCSATCTIERAVESYTCPGKPIRLQGDAPGLRTLRVQGTTAPAPGETLPASKWSSTTAANCQSTARDVVYQLTSDIDGYLKATVTGTQANLFASLRSSCVVGQATAPIAGACSKASTGNGPKTFYAPVSKETPYYLVVDGNVAASEGPFVLDLELAPSVCGNSVVEGGETCDDGATDDGDGCSATCQLEADKARDECATAPPLTFTANPNGTYTSTVVSGTTGLKHTAGSTTTHTLSPCSSNGPDAYFAVTPPISGVMTATLTSATFLSSIGARTACPTAGTQLACNAAAGDGGQEITFPVAGGTTYYLIVDGQNVSGRPNYGRFTMDVTVVPSGCGDTFVSPPEQCDDGNLANGDGCSSTCTIESLAGIGTCPGHTLSLTGTGATPRKKTLTIDTTGLPSNTGSACGGSGPEGVIAITSDVDGLLEVSGTSSHAMLVYGRTTCGDPTTETPKSSCPTTSTSILRNLSASIKKNTPYYVFVDGINGAAGVTKLQITVTP